MTSRRRSKRIETAIQPKKASVNTIGIAKAGFEIKQTATTSTEDTGGSASFGSVGTKKDEAVKTEDALSGFLGK